MNETEKFIPGQMVRVRDDENGRPLEREFLAMTSVGNYLCWNESKTTGTPWRHAYAENPNAPKGKSIREWLSELPAGIRERALAQIDVSYKYYKPYPESLKHAINTFSRWEETNEGYDFWCDVQSAATVGSEFPKLPEPKKRIPLEPSDLDARTDLRIKHVEWISLRSTINAYDKYELAIAMLGKLNVINWEDLADNYTWLDGEPCSKEETK